MFRLFLRNKKLAESGKRPKKTSGAKPARNRRIFERYTVDHKHLTMLNEQDILLIRDISAKGFSTFVSERGYSRLELGDVYQARMRYLGEFYDLQAKVSWKENGVVGFELENADRSILQFMQRLLRPMEIAHSLKAVEANFMAENHSGKTWYHGDGDSDLYVWHDRAGIVVAWQLVVSGEYVEWSANGGLKTGVMQTSHADQKLKMPLNAPVQVADASMNKIRRQLATDVVMALPLPVREELINTLTAG